MREGEAADRSRGRGRRPGAPNEALLGALTEGEASDDELVDAVTAFRPRVVVVAVESADADCAGAKQSSSHTRRARVFLVRTDDFEGSARALADAVVNASDNLARLTSGQSAVLWGLVNGQSAEVMAANWGRSVAKVRADVAGVLHTLVVQTQLQAVAVARAAGWQWPPNSDGP